MIKCVSSEILRLSPITGLGLIALVFAGALVFITLRMIKQSIRLHNSIVLVQLHSPVLLFWILFFVTLVPMLYFIINALSPADDISEFFFKSFGYERAGVSICMSFCAAIFACVALLHLVLAMSKCAVLDKGVYSKNYFYDWYKIYDYLVDEEHSTVILSANKAGALSLKGICPPLKFKREDTERIKFILNKNKNKFLSSYEVR